MYLCCRCGFNPGRGARRGLLPRPAIAPAAQRASFSRWAGPQAGDGLRVWLLAGQERPQLVDDQLVLPALVLDSRRGRPIRMHTRHPGEEDRRGPNPSSTAQAGICRGVRPGHSWVVVQLAQCSTAVSLFPPLLGSSEVRPLTCSACCPSCSRRLQRSAWLACIARMAAASFTSCSRRTSATASWVCAAAASSRAAAACWAATTCKHAK
jgi:hypothetical protein